MKYFVWLSALLSDLLLLVICAILVYGESKSSIALLAILACAVQAFKASGGFDAWRPKLIAQFTRNFPHK